MYYVNDGVYGSFNCLMYDHAVVKPCILKVSFITLIKNLCEGHFRIFLVLKVFIPAASGDLLAIV